MNDDPDEGTRPSNIPVVGQAAALLVPLAIVFHFFGDTLHDWIARSHDESWPWHSLNSVTEQYKLHPTFLLAEFTFISSTFITAWHAITTDAKRTSGSSQQNLKLLWLLTFVAGTANDYIFMLMPMVDNFWQAQAIIMLTPRMPLYIPCVYNAFMYWSCAAAWRVCRGGSNTNVKNVSVAGEACFAALLGAVFYAPYDLCGARFLWWTWHLDDAAVKMRWGGNEPVDGIFGKFLNAITGSVADTNGATAVPGGGAPAGSTAWTLVFGFCFAYLLRIAHDKRFGSVATVGLVAGLSTLVMMAILGVLTFVAGDRLGMPGPNTLLLTLLILVVTCARSSLGRVPRSKGPFTVRLFLVVYFATLALVMLFAKPENQISTGCHQTFALDGCSAEDLDMIEYRRMKYSCQKPPPHLPVKSEGESTPWHARGWAHDPQVLPKVHHPHEYLEFDCARTGVSGLVPPETHAVDNGDGEGALSSWYSVCGVPSSNARGLAWVTALGCIGSLAYVWGFSAST